jgi:hypothetical protein
MPSGAVAFLPRTSILPSVTRLMIVVTAYDEVLVLIRTKVLYPAPASFGGRLRARWNEL